jgi:hypothetical protein
VQELPVFRRSYRILYLRKEAEGVVEVLRFWQIRPEDSPLLFWERDGHGLGDAKERAERLADQHAPVITQ